MISGRPKVSIIITCYNYEAYVEQAIASALSQNYDNLEVIVIDDGSKDQSWTVIQSFDSKITAIRTENRGSISACLTGFSMSSGAYILFLDADDMLDPNALSVVSGFLDGSTSKIQFRLQPINAAGNSILSPFPEYKKDTTSKSLINSIKTHGTYKTPPTSGNIYLRDVYTQVGNVNYDVGIDGVSYLLAPFVGEVVSINKVLGYYRMHGNNLSSITKITPERLMMERRIFLSRLEHLDNLIKQNFMERQGFYLKTDYLYSVERDIYTKLLLNVNLDFRLRAKYIQLVTKESSGIAFTLYLSYALAIILLGNRSALKLMLFRVNGTNRSSIRRLLKQRFNAS